MSDEASDQKNADNKVVSIFHNTPPPELEIDPMVAGLLDELVQHVNSNNKIRALAWVIVGEGGNVITGRHLSGLWGLPLLGGLDWVKHQILKQLDE